MAEPKAKQKDHEPLWVSRALGTKALLRECAALTPLDDYGRKVPLYAVAHKALDLYLASLNGKSSAGPTLGKPRRMGPGNHG